MSFGLILLLIVLAPIAWVLEWILIPFIFTMIVFIFLAIITFFEKLAGMFKR